LKNDSGKPPTSSGQIPNSPPLNTHFPSWDCFSFAITLKTKNAYIAKISEALGHADIGTTKTYMKRFEDSELDRLDELI
jgi:hypothetical protein